MAHIHESIRPSGTALTGRCHVPGDKSISHRAVMFAGIAEGETTIHNFLDGHDCRATVEVMRDLGVQIETSPPRNWSSMAAGWTV